MKALVLKSLGLGLVVLGVAASAGARVIATPEIDPSSAVNALALLSGAVLLFRSRRR